MEDRREKIKDRLNRLAAEFYLAMGYKARKGFDFQQSQHPQERLCYGMAELAWEEFMGDSPDYAEDEDEEGEGEGEIEGGAIAGCLFPGKCVMVGEHFSHECMTGEEIEEYYSSQWTGGIK